jgi:hypothetical protein
MAVCIQLQSKTSFSWKGFAAGRKPKNLMMTSVGALQACENVHLQDD